MQRLLLGVVLCGALLVTTIGCHPRRRAVAPSEPPAVPVSQPVEGMVTDFVDFTGRTDAVEAVDIRARVTGYLKEMPFKEGKEVKKGDLLFEVDPRPYKAQLDQAMGQVNLYKAAQKLAETTYARDRAIYAASTGAVSQQQLDQDRAAVDEAAARVKAFEAMTEVYKLNLEFCKVTSPIDGRISRYYLTRGNLVNQDQTLLSTVVSLDPMYAYFDLDEPTLLKIRRAINEGKIKRPGEGEIPLFMRLQGEEGYPHEGRVNFVNNQVNPTTGSISVRGVFPNPPLGQGVRLLSPGMFVRIRLPIGGPHSALQVIDRAIVSDQGLKYVYVDGAENKVEYRRVETGPLQDNGLRVIASGLKPNEWVVVGGLQQLSPRMTIRPDQQPMPRLDASQSRQTTPEAAKEQGPKK
jgi:multidrug efflux system membrane fusion protein